jgi:hypothetical protein
MDAQRNHGRLVDVRDQRDVLNVRWPTPIIVRAWGAVLALGGFVASVPAAEVALTYRDLILSDAKPSLVALVQSADAASGAVTIGGADARRPTVPFRFDWGDGKTARSFFPATHTYKDRARSYTITIVATYADGTHGSTEASVRFVEAPIVLGPFTASEDLAVSVPAALPAITSTMSGYRLPAMKVFPPDLVSESRRVVAERVMNALALIERDLVNTDLVRTAGSFRQIVMMAAEPAQPYAFSVWFAQPVTLVAQASVLGADPDWSTVAHEMAHNFTLNSPAAYRLGGKIDGPANAIVSEALAQIFQHVACHALVNHATDYGIPEPLARDIARRARASFTLLKSEGAAGMFAGWNDPRTPRDETRPTFMAIAYQFLAADPEGTDYRAATQRLMAFLQHFNPAWHERFSPQANSRAAEMFRATLMVAAVSHGVQRDLRPKFRALGFPIDDTVFAELTHAVEAAR